jgi:acetyl-CoA acetyltransferase
MPNDGPAIWLVSGVRTPFVNVDGPFAKRDALTLSVPVAQAMAQQVKGKIDFGVWGSVVVNLAYANLAREIWLEAKLDPHVPTFTTIMQCSTSMVGVFEAAGILDQRRASLAMVGGVSTAPAVAAHLRPATARRSPTAPPRSGSRPRRGSAACRRRRRGRGSWISKWRPSIFSTKVS